MVAVATEFRFKPDAVAMCDAMPFQQHFEARCEQPLEDLDLFECFHNISNFEVGDQVTICAYMPSTDWGQLMEVGTARVIAGGKKHGKPPRLAWVSSIFEVPQDDESKKMFSEKLVKLYPKREFGGGYTVQDEKGNVIERVKTKKEALDYIDRLNQPTPKPEALLESDIVS